MRPIIYEWEKAEFSTMPFPGYSGWFTDRLLCLNAMSVFSEEVHTPLLGRGFKQQIPEKDRPSHLKIKAR